jgi:hypothetical protein
MDPTDPGGRPPEPERPTPPSPAWPPPPRYPGWGTPVPQGPPGWGMAPPPPPRRRVGWIVAALAGLLVLAVAAAVLVARLDAPLGSAQRAVGQRPAAMLPPDPYNDLPKLLAKRAKAVLDDDRTAFMATVDKRQKGFYTEQATVFARMRTVPFSDFSYHLGSSLRPRGSLKRRYAAAQVYQAQVEARFRFRGQDASPVIGRDSFTFVLTTASGWRIAGPGDRQMRGHDDVEIWDGGQVRSARSARTLIVYHPGQEQLAARLLRAADRAYGQVAAAWTGRWERKAVILVPRDQNEAERLVGARDLSRVAAVASSSVESGQAERVLGNRIVVNTTNVVRYDALNLQVLVTHEMTHVATRTLGDGVPLVLVEGFADWAALKPVGLPLALTRPALDARVDAGRFDGALPSDAELRSGDAALAYDEGSSFCLWVDETYGVGKLQALYRQFKGSYSPGPIELDRGFRRVLGISARTAESRWAAWVRARL